MTDATSPSDAGYGGDPLGTLLLPAASRFAEMTREEQVDALAEVLRTWNSDEQVALVAEAAITALRAGAPRPALLSIAEEAAEWSLLAAPGELAAYAWHAARRLPATRRAGLIRALAQLGDEVAA